MGGSEPVRSALYKTSYFTRFYAYLEASNLVIYDVLWCRKRLKHRILRCLARSRRAKSTYFTMFPQGGPPGGHLSKHRILRGFRPSWPVNPPLEHRKMRGFALSALYKTSYFTRFYAFLEASNIVIYDVLWCRKRLKHHILRCLVISRTAKTPCFTMFREGGTLQNSSSGGLFWALYLGYGTSRLVFTVGFWHTGALKTSFSLERGCDFRLFGVPLDLGAPNRASP